MNTQTAEETYTWECPACGTTTVLGRAGGNLNDCPPECPGYEHYPGPNFIIHGPDGDQRVWDHIALTFTEDGLPVLPTKNWVMGTTQELANPVWDPKLRKVVEGPNEEDTPETTTGGWYD